MKKFWIQVIALLVVGFTAMYLSFNSTSLDSYFPQLQPGGTTTSKPKEVQIGTATIAIEVADTAALRSKGLGDRQSLESNKGMLFIFSETKKYQFWMKGLKFPLDIIWIKDDMVVDILKNIPAPAQGTADQELPIYEPITPINKVIEVNAGFVTAHGIKVGDQVTLIK